jgi:hypothetical protein
MLMLAQAPVFTSRAVGWNLVQRNKGMVDCPLLNGGSEMASLLRVLFFFLLVQAATQSSLMNAPLAAGCKALQAAAQTRYFSSLIDGHPCHQS